MDTVVNITPEISNEIAPEISPEIPNNVPIPMVALPDYATLYSWFYSAQGYNQYLINTLNERDSTIAHMTHIKNAESAKFNQVRTVNEKLIAELKTAKEDNGKLRTTILQTRLYINLLIITCVFACEYLLLMGRRFRAIFRHARTLETALEGKGISFRARANHMSILPFDTKLDENTTAYLNKPMDIDAVMECVLSLGESRPVEDLKKILGRDTMSICQDEKKCAEVAVSGKCKWFPDLDLSK